MIIITRKSFKYRINLIKARISNFENQFSTCRRCFNRLIGEWLAIATTAVKFTTQDTQKSKHPHLLNKKRPRFKDVYSQILQNMFEHLDNICQFFFYHAKKGELKNCRQCNCNNYLQQTYDLNVVKFSCVQILKDVNFVKRYKAQSSSLKKSNRRVLPAHAG